MKSRKMWFVTYAFREDGIDGFSFRSTVTDTPPLEFIMKLQGNGEGGDYALINTWDMPGNVSHQKLKKVFGWYDRNDDIEDNMKG